MLADAKLALKAKCMLLNVMLIPETSSLVSELTRGANPAANVLKMSKYGCDSLISHVFVTIGEDVASGWIPPKLQNRSR